MYCTIVSVSWMGTGSERKPSTSPAQVDVADVVHPLGVEIDLNKSTFLSEADVHDLFGLDVCVVDGGLCDIVMNAPYKTNLPPSLGQAQYRRADLIQYNAMLNGV